MTVDNMNAPAAGSLHSDGIAQPDNTVRKFLAYQQFQTEVSMAWCDQRNTLSDHLRNHVDDKFVHLPGVEKGGNKFSRAYQPNVLAFIRAQAFGEDRHVFTNC